MTGKRLRLFSRRVAQCQNANRGSNRPL